MDAAIGRSVHTSKAGRVELYVERETWDMRIELLPGYDVADLRTIIAEVKALGLELVDPWDFEPEIRADGTKIIHLTDPEGEW